MTRKKWLTRKKNAERKKYAATQFSTTTACRQYFHHSASKATVSTLNEMQKKVNRHGVLIGWVQLQMNTSSSESLFFARICETEQTAVVKIETTLNWTVEVLRFGGEYEGVGRTTS